QERDQQPCRRVHGQLWSRRRGGPGARGPGRGRARLLSGHRLAARTRRRAPPARGHVRRRSTRLSPRAGCSVRIVAELPPQHARAGAAVRAYDRAVCGVALATRALSRLARAGAGTSAPGIVIQRLDPGFVRRRGSLLPDGVTIVSGTNGKTTTAAMIAG